MRIRRNHLIEFKQTVEFPAAKPDTYELEAGRRGLSHFIVSKGLSCVVVGRDGRGYG